MPIVPAAVIYDLGRGGRFRATPDAAFGPAAYDAATSLQVDGSDGHAATSFQEDGPDGHAAVRWVFGRTERVCRGRDRGRGGWARRGCRDRERGAALGGDRGRAGGRQRRRVRPGPGQRRSCPAPATGSPASSTTCGEPSAEEVAAWRPAGVTSLNTTIGVVATDLTLTKAQCGKLAGVAHDGLARAIRPAHTMVDGDTIFAVSTCALPHRDPSRPVRIPPGHHSGSRRPWRRRGARRSVSARPARGRGRCVQPGRGARRAGRDRACGRARVSRRVPERPSANAMTDQGGTVTFAGSWPAGLPVGDGWAEAPAHSDVIFPYDGSVVMSRARGGRGAGGAGRGGGARGRARDGRAAVARPPRRADGRARRARRAAGGVRAAARAGDRQAAGGLPGRGGAHARHPRHRRRGGGPAAR